MTPERILVIGAGDIGAPIGARLHALGRPVTLVARGEHGRAMARDGVRIRTPRDHEHLFPPVVQGVHTLSPTPNDLVIVSVMGHHTAAALDGLDPRIPIVSLQNGSTPLDEIARRGHPLVAGMVYVPAARRAPGVIALSAHPHGGALWFGGWKGHPSPKGVAGQLADDLAQCDFHTLHEPDLTPWIYAKLLANLGGIVVALSKEPVIDVIEAATTEAIATWQAAGLAFETVETLVARVGPLTVELVDGLPRIGGSTATALRKGVPLETASIHSPIVSLGSVHGIPTPVNAALIRLADTATTAHAMTPSELRAEVGL